MSSLNRKLEIEQAIADIESAMNAGATSHSSDGQSTNWDQKALRQRWLDLTTELDEINKKPARRPVFYTINLSSGGPE